MNYRILLITTAIILVFALYYIGMKGKHWTTTGNDALRNNINVHEFKNGRIFTSDRLDLFKEAAAILDQADMDEIAEYLATVLYVREAECTHNQRFGNSGNGGWDVCLVGPYHPKHQCLVFSFGINYDFSFDDAVDKSLNCTVHSFDPTMKKLSSHRRSKNSYFHRLGIGGSKAESVSKDYVVIRSKYSGNRLTFGPVDTLLGIKKMLEFDDNAVIDILKMDVELSEFPAFQTAFQDGSLSSVKQLAIEVHVMKNMTRTIARTVIDTLVGLRKHGFRLWRFNWNAGCWYRSKLHFRTRCHELYYINTNFLKSASRNVNAEKWLSNL